MFDKFKQMAQLKALQNELSKQTFDATFQGVTVTVSGDMSIRNVVLNPELDINQQALAVKDAINGAMNEAKKGMAKQLSGMGLGM